MSLRTLQVVTTRSPFFSKQVEALRSQGVECTTVSVPSPAEGSRSVGEYLRFYASVLRRGLASYDLVHANYGLTGPFALAQPRRPVVLTLWGSEVMGASAWVRRASRWAAARADAVVAPSAAVATELDGDAHTIPFPVERDLFHPMDREQARSVVGWDPDATVVLFPYSPDRAVKNYPLAERVVEAVSGAVDLRTVSGVPYEEMPYYMNASDAVLVTSRRESGPMVVKEAAACGVPVVATDVGFVREVLADRPDSVVGESRDELVAGLEAVLDGERATPDGGRVDPVDVATMGERLVAVYERALARREGPA